MALQTRLQLTRKRQQALINAIKDRLNKIKDEPSLKEEYNTLVGCLKALLMENE